MPLRSYTTVHLIIPLTPKTIANIHKITDELTQRFGGITNSRVAIPSSFVGHWVTVRNGEKVVVDPQTASILDICRGELLDDLAKNQRAAYGINTGFAGNQNRPVSQDFLDELQINLIRSHSVGVGKATSIEVVRAAMLLRAQSLSKGYSGVRSKVVQQLVDFLNHNIIPVVPQDGSVGASGDLAPMSHIALALMGEGEVFYGPKGEGQRIQASEALKRAGLEPLRLGAKEGLALNNGVQYSTAIGVLSYHNMVNLLKHAALTTAIASQVMLGKETPFDEDAQKLRPYPGAQEVSRWVRQLLQDSPILKTIALGHDGNAQDPYNLRCSPQILGACLDLLEDARNSFEIEINSATDNPLILPGSEGRFTRVVSVGHFHGMPVATRIYGLIQAAGIMAALSNVRCSRYIDRARSRGLPGDLALTELSREELAASSAMMIPEYVTAALANKIWGLSTPSHLMSIQTAAGTEDHVSMAPNIANRLYYEIIPSLTNILAIEFACGAQAAAIRKSSNFYPSVRSLPSQQPGDEVTKKTEELEQTIAKVLGSDSPYKPKVTIALNCPWEASQRDLSPPCQNVINRVWQVFPPVTKDRAMSDQFEQLAELISSGELPDIAKQKPPG